MEPNNPKEENVSGDSRKSPLSNPEAKHEAEAQDFEAKGKQGSTISKLFKPKGHRKAASLKALNSEGEQSQLDTNPECDQPRRKNNSGLKDIPASSFTNEGDVETGSSVSKPGFFSRMKAKWFSKGNPEILQEEESQNVTDRNVSLKNARKIKLEGAYDTEREFMESVMTEKNVMDSYRVDGGERDLVNKGSSKSMKALTKVLIAAVILMLVAGLILGAVYIKNNSHLPTQTKSSVTNAKVSFSEFGQFTKSSEAFKPEEIVAVAASTEKESIFKKQTIYFNSEQQIQQRVRTETNYIVKRGRRLQEGTPSVLPETRTEKTETEELYKMITYKNAQGKPESIISFEGMVVNGKSMLPGTQQLSSLQDINGKYPELAQTQENPMPSGGTRLLQMSSKLRKLQAPTFTDMNAAYEIDGFVKPKCYKPMAKIYYNDNFEASGISFSGTQYYDILDNFNDILLSIKPKAERQYYQDNDNMQVNFTDKDHVLVKTNENSTQYDQFGNQKEYTQISQSSIYSKDSQLLSQVKTINSSLPTDTKEGEIASVNTQVERQANLQKISTDSIEYIQKLFDFSCARDYCITKSVDDFQALVKNYIDTSNEQKMISSSLEEVAPTVTTNPNSTVQPFAMTVFDVTTAGERLLGTYEVTTDDKNFTATFTVRIGSESHVIFSKTGNVDYLQNSNLLRRIFNVIQNKWKTIITYTTDKFNSITSQLAYNRETFDNMMKQAIADIEGFTIKSVHPDMEKFMELSNTITIILNDFRNKIGGEFDKIIAEGADEISEIREYMITPIIADLTHKNQVLEDMLTYLNAKSTAKISKDFLAQFEGLADVLNGDFHVKLLEYKKIKMQENYDNKKELFQKIIIKVTEQIDTIAESIVTNSVLRDYAKKFAKTFFSENYLKYIGVSIHNFKAEVELHHSAGTNSISKVLLKIDENAKKIKDYLTINGDETVATSADEHFATLLEECDNGVHAMEDYNPHNTFMYGAEKIFRAHNKDMLEAYFNEFKAKFDQIETSIEAAKAKIMAMLYKIEQSFLTNFQVVESSIHDQVLELWNQVNALFKNFELKLNLKNNIYTLDETNVPSTTEIRDLTKLTILQDEMQDTVNYKFHNQLEGIRKDFMTLLYDKWNLQKPKIAELVKVYKTYDELDKLYLDFKVVGLEWAKLISVGDMIGATVDAAIEHSNLLLVTIPHQISFTIHDQINNKIVGKLSSFFTVSLMKLTRDTIETRSATFLTQLKEIVPKKEGQELLFKEATIYKKLLRSNGISSPVHTKFEFFVDVTSYLTWVLDLLTGTAGVDTAINVHVQVTSTSTPRISGTESIYTGVLADGRVAYGVKTQSIPQQTTEPQGKIDLNLFKTLSGVRKWDVEASYTCLSDAEVENTPAANDKDYYKIHRFMAGISPAPADYSTNAVCDLCTPKVTYKFSNPTFINGPIESPAYEYKKEF